MLGFRLDKPGHEVLIGQLGGAQNPTCYPGCLAPKKVNPSELQLSHASGQDTSHSPGFGRSTLW